MNRIKRSWYLILIGLVLFGCQPNETANDLGNPSNIISPNSPNSSSFNIYSIVDGKCMESFLPSGSQDAVWSEEVCMVYCKPYEAFSDLYEYYYASFEDPNNPTVTCVQYTLSTNGRYKKEWIDGGAGKGEYGSFCSGQVLETQIGNYSFAKDLSFLTLYLDSGDVDKIQIWSTFGSQWTEVGVTQYNIVNLLKGCISD